MSQVFLSDRNLRVALRLKKQGLKCREIAIALNRPKAEIKASIRKHKDRQRETNIAKAHAERIALITRARASLQRPARTCKIPKSITSEFCGDPSPERSALGKPYLVGEDE